MINKADFTLLYYLTLMANFGRLCIGLRDGENDLRLYVNDGLVTKADERLLNACKSMLKHTHPRISDEKFTMSQIEMLTSHQTLNGLCCLMTQNFSHSSIKSQSQFSILQSMIYLSWRQGSISEFTQYFHIEPIRGIGPHSLESVMCWPIHSVQQNI